MLKVEEAELKMLRFLLEVTRMDRIRKKHFRRTAQVEWFGDKLREARLKWFGHVQRRIVDVLAGGKEGPKRGFVVKEGMKMKEEEE